MNYHHFTIEERCRKPRLWTNTKIHKSEQFTIKTRTWT